MNPMNNRVFVTVSVYDTRDVHVWDTLYGLEVRSVDHDNKRVTLADHATDDELRGGPA